MGCDIHTITEVRINGVWFDAKLDKPIFDWRSYGMYAFLADVRNYSAVPSLWANRGWPRDVCDAAAEKSSDWAGDAHSYTFVTLHELLTFDYEQTVEDRRVMRERSPRFFNGAVTAEAGEGKTQTYREFLLSGFFAEIDRLKTLGAPDDVRVLMFFDN